MFETSEKACHHFCLSQKQKSSGEDRFDCFIFFIPYFFSLFADAMHAAIFKCYEAGITTPRPLANMIGNFFSIENLSTSKHTGNKNSRDSKVLQNMACYPTPDKN